MRREIIVTRMRVNGKGMINDGSRAKLHGGWGSLGRGEMSLVCDRRGRGVG